MLLFCSFLFLHPPAFLAALLLVICVSLLLFASQNGSGSGPTTIVSDGSHVFRSIALTIASTTAAATTATATTTTTTATTTTTTTTTATASTTGQRRSRPTMGRMHHTLPAPGRGRRCTHVVGDGGGGRRVHHHITLRQPRQRWAKHTSPRYMYVLVVILEAFSSCTLPRRGTTYACITGFACKQWGGRPCQYATETFLPPQRARTHTHQTGVGGLQTERQRGGEGYDSRLINISNRCFLIFHSGTIQHCTVRIRRSHHYHG